MDPFVNHHDYESSEQEESQDEEEPEEPLGIMPKIAAIVFFVALLHLSSFFDKHSIDLSDMLLHFVEKPRVFDPRGRVALTPENVFILTPKKPWPVGSFLFRLTCLL